MIIRYKRARKFWWEFWLPRRPIIQNNFFTGEPGGGIWFDVDAGPTKIEGNTFGVV